MKVSNYKEYALFDYSDYLSPIPDEQPFDLGDIVYNKQHNTIGVVIGCIDYGGEELRTDMDGMQFFQDLELATLEHFQIKDVNLGIQNANKMIREFFGISCLESQIRPL